MGKSKSGEAKDIKVESAVVASDRPTVSVVSPPSHHSAVCRSSDHSAAHPSPGLCSMLSKREQKKIAKMTAMITYYEARGQAFTNDEAKKDLSLDASHVLGTNPSLASPDPPTRG